MPTLLITSYSANQTTTINQIDIKYLITDATAMTYNQAMAVMPSANSVEVIDGINCYLKSRTVTVVDGSIAKVWEGSATYSDESTNSVAPTFIAKDMSTNAVATDFWRAVDSVPDVNNPSSSDIGGTAIDSFGDPVTVFVPQQEMTVTNFRADNNATAILTATGRRNNANYNGAPAGYLVFAGATARRVSTAQYEVTYKMTYDPLGHCRQVALGDSAGIKMGAESGSPPVCNASLVVWRQPFPTTVSFSAIGINLT